MGIPTECRLGYGLMNLTFKASPTPDDQAFAAIKASIDGGCTVLNSAEFYGYHDPTSNLQLLNRFYTKYPEYISTTYLSVKGGFYNHQPDASEANLHKSVMNINAVLGVKKMDLFQMARVDKNVPIEDTMRTLLKLRDEGHFKDIGLSEVSADTINRAVKIAPIAAVEVEYSPFSLDIEHNGVLAACKAHNIPIAAYSPLGRGLLTGTIKKPEDLPENDYRRGLDRFQPDVFQNNLVVAEKLENMARQKGITPAQLVLAWIINQWEGFYPIPGSTRLEGVQEALGALDVRFEAKELEKLRKIVDSADIKGGRYSAYFEGALVG